MFALLAVLACALAIGMTARAVRAQQRFVLTSHVPQAVSGGIAHLISPLPIAQRLNLALVLQLRDEAALRALVQQIYDPHSSSYHKYLTEQQFVERFSPTQADYDAVLSFAGANGLSVVHTSSNRMVVDVEGPVENVNKALNVTLNTYQHPTEARTFFAPDREPSPNVAVPLLHIAGLDDYTLARSKLVKPSKSGITAKGLTGSGSGGQFLGSDLRAAYYGTGSLKGAGQSVGLLEKAGYNINDVKAYFKSVNQSFTVPVHGVELNNVSLSCTGSCDDSEQVLDIETVISMAPHLDQVVVYVGSQDVSIFNQMAADDTSKQLSVSWGWGDDETSIDPILEEMAVQGQTMFVATGDNGSASVADYVWPADDPYVVAVGGTNLTTTGPGGAWKSETGWSGSAGGPSKNNVPIPFYQTPGIINASNGASKALRNYPDISAAATNMYSCYDGGCSTGNGGTSYAAPQWAGLTALINEEAAEHHQAAAGFEDPALYAIGASSKEYGESLHDITSGNNGGFNAVKGYDLVTGWGTPKVDLLYGLSGVPIPGKPVVTISYHQVGACNGFNTAYGETNAGPNAAFVVFAIESVDNTKTASTFSFDPSRLYVRQTIDEFMDQGLLSTIPSGSQVRSTSIAKGKVVTLSPHEFGPLVVSTKNANGAVEADQKAYDLNYNRKNSDPQVATKNTNPSRKAWPQTLDCSTIVLR